jgi:hypothetical protein
MGPVPFISQIATCSVAALRHPRSSLPAFSTPTGVTTHGSDVRMVALDFLIGSRRARRQRGRNAPWQLMLAQ